MAMNILITTHQGGLAGSTNSIFYLSRGLAKRGHKVYVGCPQSSLLFSLLENTAVIRIPMVFRGKLDLNNVRHIRDVVKQYGIELINVQSSKDRYTVGLARWIYKLPCKVIHTRRQIPKSTGLFIQNWFYTKSTDAMVAVSSGVKAELVKKGISPDHIKVIQNGTPKEKYKLKDPSKVGAIREKLGIGSNDVAVGCIARRKKQEQLLLALPHLPASVKVFLIGIEEDEQLAQIVQEHQLASRVMYCGSVPPEEILYYHKAMDLEVLPSTMEGLSQSLLEAMALGIPVVATRAAGNPDLIRDGENGLLFEDGDSQGLAEKITLLMEDQELYDKLVERGKHTALEEFEISHVIDRYEAFFQQLLT